MTVFAACVLALGGCAAGSGSASVAGCTSIAVRAARGQVKLTAVPGPCRRLGPARLSQTVKIAVYDVARGGSKSRRRHLAIQAYRRLAVLTTAADREAAAQRTAQARRRAAHPHSPRTGAAPKLRVPAGLAALVAWLLTASVGSALALRRRGRRPLRRLLPSLPPVLIAHLSFALAGLVVWVAYLVTDWTALAWAALGVLLPVAGLGMGTLIQAIPDPKPGAAERQAAGTEPATTGAAAGSAATATRLTAPETAVQRRRSRTPVLLIAAHGTLATLTILLALLGAIAAIAR